MTKKISSAKSIRDKAKTQSKSKSNIVKKPNNRVSFDDGKKVKFLRHLSRSCNVQQSADHTGVSIDTVYRHRKNHEGFRAQWAEAIEIAYDELMLEMLRRARYGTEKPIIYGGKKTGSFNDLNDMMAMRLLSMHMANVAQHKTGKKSNMTQSDDVHQLLMQRLVDIKKRLNPVEEIKSIDIESDDQITGHIGGSIHKE